MKVGIVGMPNAGKSSLFNALTQAGAEAANYPFTTIEPNVAIVPVPDERMEPVAAFVRRVEHRLRTRSPSTTSPASCAARSEGEGLGNQFLANIRETDAIVHVVRAHHDDYIFHSEGRVDPARDVEIIETELIYADLEQAERRLERVVRTRAAATRRRSPSRPGSRRSSPRCRPARPARSVPVPDAADSLRNRRIR